MAASNDAQLLSPHHFNSFTILGSLEPTLDVESLNRLVKQKPTLRTWTIDSADSTPELSEHEDSQQDEVTSSRWHADFLHQQLMPRLVAHYRTATSEIQDPRESITDVNYWKTEAKHFAKLLGSEDHRRSITVSQYWRTEAGHYDKEWWRLMNMPSPVTEITQRSTKVPDTISISGNLRAPFTISHDERLLGLDHRTKSASKGHKKLWTKERKERRESKPYYRRGMDRSARNAQSTSIEGPISTRTRSRT